MDQRKIIKQLRKSKLIFSLFFVLPFIFMELSIASPIARAMFGVITLLTSTLMLHLEKGKFGNETDEQYRYRLENIKYKKGMIDRILTIIRFITIILIIINIMIHNGYNGALKNIVENIVDKLSPIVNALAEMSD